MKSPKINILVVDDDVTLLQTIAELFRTFNFQVETASSGDAAWEVYQKGKFDLVITDIRMPKGDGIELAKKIKSLKNKKTSLLFITGYTDQSNEEIYNIGAEGIFTKPFESSSVIKAMNICLRPLENKWSQPAPEKIDFKINKTGSSIEELESKKIIQFGRGGFSVSLTEEIPKINSIVSFKFTTTQSTPNLIEGVGIVRWVSNQKSFGVEILSMDHLMATSYQKKFSDRTAFIPKGTRNL